MRQQDLVQKLINEALEELGFDEVEAPVPVDLKTRIAEAQKIECTLKLGLIPKAVSLD